MNTTAGEPILSCGLLNSDPRCKGSYALEGSVVPRDAFVVSKLHAAGAILLGKASLAEWACFRGEGVPYGFSAYGGQATAPYYPNLDPSASSSGSAIASAIGLAAATLGSETTGSIVLPASRNNIVGIKPTVGLVSRSGGRVVTIYGRNPAEYARYQSSLSLPIKIRLVPWLAVSPMRRSSFPSSPGTTRVIPVTSVCLHPRNGLTTRRH